MTKELFLDKCEIKKIIEHFHTPFYLYDEKGIRENARRLKKAFSWNEGFKEYFAIKANPNPNILKILKEEGIGVDCSSYTELYLAEKMKYSSEDIMFTSNVTPEEDFEYARKIGAIINFDDITHIDFYAKKNSFLETMGCRYNPGGQFRIQNRIMDSPENAKFGMTKVQLFESIQRLHRLGVKNIGLHAFLASNVESPEYYPVLAALLFELAVEIKKKLKIEIAYINLSGGIGVPYLPGQKEIDIEYVGEEIRKEYEKILKAAGLDKVALYTELGRYMLAPYGVLITKVIHKKHIYKEYIGVDSCAVDLLRPAMYGAYHYITVLGKEMEKGKQRYDVIGGLCENNDKFAVDRLLPQVEIGDYLAIHDVGAHGHCMGYNYNGKLRCKEILYTIDSEAKLIRRAQNLSDYFSTIEFCKFK